MRYVIFGAGAVGGVIGARLHQSGQEVVLVARGANLEALSTDGLVLITPQEEVALAIPAVGSIAEARPGAEDVVLLTVKGQDTQRALEDLRRTGVAEPAVVLAQNGVANEPAAARLFEHVYGMLVLLPATHLEPGVVVSHNAGRSGTLPLGRYPGSVDARAEEIAAALLAARFSSEARGDVMELKYAKLLDNLSNAVQALCGSGADDVELTNGLRAEAREILDAAGIAHDVDLVPLRDGWDVRPIDGQPRGGGSTWQSVTRGAGAVETDYLNGEIVLLARQLGRAAPLNAEVQRLMRTAVAEGRAPGWRTPAEILAGARGVAG